MHKKSIRPLLFALLLLISCSPRDFLTRRLATDLLSASDEFKTPQQFLLQTGIVSNKDYVAPESLVLQHRGWISANPARCSAGLLPPPCWNLLLTPSGIEAIRTIVSSEAASKSSLTIPVAKREFLGVTGITKQGSLADVEFTWKWTALNEVGAALYSGDLRYKSTVGFRQYDDGWRIVQSAPHFGQTMDDAFKNAEPVP
jgi:hypothetical protein